MKLFGFERPYMNHGCLDVMLAPLNPLPLCSQCDIYVSKMMTSLQCGHTVCQLCWLDVRNGQLLCNICESAMNVTSRKFYSEDRLSSYMVSCTCDREIELRYIKEHLFENKSCLHNNSQPQKADTRRQENLLEQILDEMQSNHEIAVDFNTDMMQLMETNETGTQKLIHDLSMVLKELRDVRRDVSEVKNKTVKVPQRMADGKSGVNEVKQEIEAMSRIVEELQEDIQETRNGVVVVQHGFEEVKEGVGVLSRTVEQLVQRADEFQHGISEMKKEVMEEVENLKNETDEGKEVSQNMVEAGETMKQKLEEVRQELKEVKEGMGCMDQKLEARSGTFTLNAAASGLEEHMRERSRIIDEKLNEVIGIFGRGIDQKHDIDSRVLKDISEKVSMISECRNSPVVVINNVRQQLRNFKREFKFSRNFSEEFTCSGMAWKLIFYLRLKPEAESEHRKLCGGERRQSCLHYEVGLSWQSPPDCGDLLLKKKLEYELINNQGYNITGVLTCRGGTILCDDGTQISGAPNHIMTAKNLEQLLDKGEDILRFKVKVSDL